MGKLLLLIGVVVCCIGCSDNGKVYRYPLKGGTMVSAEGDTAKFYGGELVAYPDGRAQVENVQTEELLLYNE